MNQQLTRALVVKLDIIPAFEAEVPGSNPGEGTKNMKKTFAIIFLLFLTLPVFACLPIGTVFAAVNPTEGQPLVPCGNPGQEACTIDYFFEMLERIYNFIVWNIATPLAIIGLTIGGIFMLISAGDPGLFNKGKEILKWSIIGLVLVFGSFVIIGFILKTLLGYTGNWWQL